MLHAQSFDGSHTGDAICATVSGMVQSWDLGKENVHLVVSDNATNKGRWLTQ